MKRLGFRCIRGKRLSPRRLEVDRIREDEAGIGLQTIGWNQIANALARLLEDPGVYLSGGATGILGEINQLERGTITLLDQREESFPEIIALLREEPVCDRQRDRLLRSAKFPGFGDSLDASFRHLLQLPLKVAEGSRRGLIFRQMQDPRHLIPGRALGAGERHRERVFNRVRGKAEVVSRGELSIKIEPNLVRGGRRRAGICCKKGGRGAKHRER